jgi:hypothetical protein
MEKKGRRLLSAEERQSIAKKRITNDFLARHDTSQSAQSKERERQIRELLEAGDSKLSEFARYKRIAELRFPEAADIFECSKDEEDLGLRIGFVRQLYGVRANSGLVDIDGTYTTCLYKALSDLALELERIPSNKLHKYIIGYESKEFRRKLTAEERQMLIRQMQQRFTYRLVVVDFIYERIHGLGEGKGLPIPVLGLEKDALSSGTLPDYVNWTQHNLKLMKGLSLGKILGYAAVAAALLSAISYLGSCPFDGAFSGPTSGLGTQIQQNRIVLNRSPAEKHLASKFQQEH